MDFSDWETTPGRRFPAEYEESVVTKCSVNFSFLHISYQSGRVCVFHLHYITPQS